MRRTLSLPLLLLMLTPAVLPPTAGAADQQGERVQQEQPDQRGRPRLLIQTAVTSLGLYGPALPYALGVKGGSEISALYLAAAGVGFVVPYFATRTAPVTPGAATLSLVGAGHGAINGVALALLIGGDRTTDRAMVGLMAVASAVESAGGLIYATTFGTSRGTAETVAVVAGLGTVFGMAAGGVLSIAPDDDNVPFYRNRAFIDENVRIYSGGGLIGSLAGAYVGHSLARAESYTRGDARVLAAAGLFGVNAGVLVVDFSDTRNARIGSGTVAIGTAVGMAAGHLLTTGRDFTAAEGSYVGLATIGGGLAGLATAALRDATPSHTHVFATAGSMLGFGVAYAVFSSDARRAATGGLLDAIDVEVNPVGLLGFVGGQRSEGMGLFRLRVGL